MKRCRCCRQDWPDEFFTVCRPDGLRRSTCNACRLGCRPDATHVRYRAYKREWAARKRADDRAAEGRGRYERRVRAA